MVMGQDVILGDREVPAKDLEKLSFNPPHIAFAEDASGHRPVDVSESRITRIL